MRSILGDYVIVDTVITTCASASMPLEALLVRFFDIHTESSSIDGGTGCNILFFRMDIVCSIKGMTEISKTIWIGSRAQFLILLEEQNNETFS